MHGALVHRLEYIPVTDERRVRFPYAPPLKKESPEAQRDAFGDFLLSGDGWGLIPAEPRWILRQGRAPGRTSAVDGVWQACPPRRQTAAVIKIEFHGFVDAVGDPIGV